MVGRTENDVECLNLRALPRRPMEPGVRTQDLSRGDGEGNWDTGGPVNSRVPDETGSRVGEAGGGVESRHYDRGGGGGGVSVV